MNFALLFLSNISITTDIIVGGVGHRHEYYYWRRFCASTAQVKCIKTSFVKPTPHPGAPTGSEMLARMYSDNTCERVLGDRHEALPISIGIMGIPIGIMEIPLGVIGNPLGIIRILLGLYELYELVQELSDFLKELFDFL